MAINSRRPILACAVSLITLSALSPARDLLAQRTSPAEGPWSGQAQCLVLAESADYRDEQTHTWRLTGAAPTAAPRGSAQVYFTWPATWSVQGAGRKSFQSRTTGAAAPEQNERWTIANEMNVTLRTTQIVGTPERLRIGVEGQRGAPLGSIRVTEVSGRTRDAAVQPWPFPAIEDNATNSTISGSNTRTYPEGFGVGWGQPPKAITTATCTWSFTRSGVEQSSANTPTGGRGRPEGARGTLGSTGTTNPAPQTPVSNETVLSTGPRATSFSLADAADLETVVRRDPTAGSGTSWALNGTARYVVTVTNRGPAVASSVILSVPPIGGLIKQGAICTATGAQCPAGLTPGSLEPGVSLPTIPVGGTINVSLFAWVRGQVGSSVTATSTVRSAATPDANAANNSSTLSHTIAPSITADPSMALITRIEADPRSTTYWQPNATARYVASLTLGGIPDVSPTTTADGAVLAVPAAENLSKTNVTCSASGGAQCPATVTVAQLESGVTIPRLPDQGTVTFAFSATVTAPLGGTVSVRSVAAPPVGYTTPDPTLLNSSKTVAILLPSGSSGNTGDASATLPTSTGATVLNSVPTSCQLAGPSVGTPTVTPTNVSFSWAHINGASYHVSRNGETVTANPITSAVYPATLNFSHSAPFYHHTTYVYTVTAQYGAGCGTSQVSFAGARPWVPVATSSVAAASGTTPRSVTVSWRVPDDIASARYYWQPIGDNAGFLVVGPGLPADGYTIWGCSGAPRYPQFAGDPVAQFPPFTTKAPYSDECYDSSVPQWAITVPVASGTHTWTVVPYWNTPFGRMADVSSGAPVTVNVP